MLEAYRIGISIALTNRVSSVLEVVAQDFANPRMPSPLPKAEILNLKEEALHKFLCLAARTALLESSHQGFDLTRYGERHRPQQSIRPRYLR